MPPRADGLARRTTHDTAYSEMTRHLPRARLRAPRPSILAICATALIGLFASACASRPAAPTVAAERVTCPSPAEDATLRVYDSTEVDRRAAAGTNMIHPGYPDELRRKGVGGRVDARWIVQRDGCVDQASIEILGATDARFVAGVRRTLRYSR